MNELFITREIDILVFPSQELCDWMCFHVYLDWPKFGQSSAMA